MPNRLRVATFNCRSVKSSLQDVISLCESHDIVCIQEHWLLPHELSLLSSIHIDFYSVGSSAVDISSDVLVGRPYGGTAILYRKSLANVVNILPSSNLSITGIIISTSDFPLLFLTVYMPTEYNDDECLEKYIDVCAHLNAIITDSCTRHVFVAGDFNCQPGSRLYGVLSHFINDNNLVVTDLSLLSVYSDSFTYCSDNGANTSWIDHVICSYAMDNTISDMSILYKCISSDHRPISLVVNCQCWLLCRLA